MPYWREDRNDRNLSILSITRWIIYEQKRTKVESFINEQTASEMFQSPIKKSFIISALQLFACGVALAVIRYILFIYLIWKQWYNRCATYYSFWSNVILLRCGDLLNYLRKNLGYAVIFLCWSCFILSIKEKHRDIPGVFFRQSLHPGLRSLTGDVGLKHNPDRHLFLIG